MGPWILLVLIVLAVPVALIWLGVVVATVLPETRRLALEACRRLDRLEREVAGIQRRIEDAGGAAVPGAAEATVVEPRGALPRLASATWITTAPSVEAPSHQSPPVAPPEPVGVWTAVPPTSGPQPVPAPAVAPRAEKDWEERIGSQWLNWLGAVTLVFAVGLFLKWAHDRGWITPLLQLPKLAYLCIGWSAGGAVLAAGEYFRRRMPLYGQALAGGGIAILYLTTYAGYALYHVLDPTQAIVALAGLGGLAMGVAIRHEAVAIGWLGIALSYASPLFFGGGGASPAPLFLFLGALNGVVLLISFIRDWHGFRAAALGATSLLYFLWFSQKYSPAYLGEAVTFVLLNSVLFLAALSAYPLRRGEPTRDLDLGPAVLTPLLGGAALHALLAGRYDQWLGLLALGSAGLYWAVSRAIRIRRGKEDYLEQLFFGTALVLAILSVPLHFHGRVMTPTWALVGAVLSVVGYLSGSGRTRVWGGVALVLAVLRLATHDALLAGPTASDLFIGRGFSFATVELGLAALAAVLVHEKAQRDDPRLDGLIALTGLVVGVVMEGWASLELSATWQSPAWFAVGALTLAFGWHLRVPLLRFAGVLLMAPGLIAAAVGDPRASWLYPTWIAAILAGAGLAWAADRAPRLEEAERTWLAPLGAGAAALTALIWSGHDLGDGWRAAAALGVVGALLAVGAAQERVSLRVLGLLAAVYLTCEVVGRELAVVPGLTPLFNPRSVALLAAAAGWLAVGWTSARFGGKDERSAAPYLYGLANVALLAWASVEAMEAARRLGPSAWGGEAAQFALSAVWGIYAVAAILAGFARFMPEARKCGIALLLLAVSKVYVIDLAALTLGYRVLSFVVLAALLMGVSFLYQRQGRGALDSAAAGRVP
jgi:uncharacterized membrane protein